MEENSGRCSSSWVSVNGCVEEICTFPYSYIYKYCCGSEPLLVLFFVCRIIIKSFQMSSERWRLWWQAYKVSPDCALSLSSAVPFSCFSSLFGRLHNLGLIKGALWKSVGDLASFFFKLFTLFILLEVNVTFFCHISKVWNQPSVCMSITLYIPPRLQQNCDLHLLLFHKNIIFLIGIPATSM